MTYIVTGATGFIGSALIKYLVSNNHNVYAICRDKNKFKEKYHNYSNLTIIECDLDNYNKLKLEIPHADIFINLAWGGITKDDRNNTEVQNLNIKYSLNAISVAKEIGCSVFVEAGSQAEYGIVSSVITENTNCNPYTEYGKAKLAIKEHAWSYSEKLNIKYIHLRIFSVYGENDHEWSMIPNCALKLIKGDALEMSMCNQMWNFLYVDDCVKQIALLSEYANNNSDFKCEIFNIASDDTRILKSYIEEMKVLSGSKSIIKYGAINQDKIVSLTPCTEKTKSAIGFISKVTFKEGFTKIINSIYEREMYTL